MKCEIVSVGTELLLGSILNTNAQYLGQQLATLGFDIYYNTVVGDNYERLSQVIKTGIERSDIIITTGGLGPTDDDITKEVAASVLNLELFPHEKSMNAMKIYFENKGSAMPDCNLKQGMFPKDSIVLENNNGTAPACIMEMSEKAIILLPGPPKEMKPIFNDSVIPYLKKKSDYAIESKVLRITGIGESEIQEVLQHIFNKQTNPTIAPYAKDTGTELRITAKAPKGQDMTEMIESMCQEVRDILGNYIFSESEETIEEVVIKKLSKNKLTIALAESCTGGLATAQLVNVSGSSETVKNGIISYSNEAKVKFLGVSPNTLNLHGAVSAETAIEMAEGVRSVSGTDIGIGITGIAGPHSDDSHQPVGLVFIALACNTGTEVSKNIFTGNRNRVRQSAVTKTLDMIRLKYL